MQHQSQIQFLLCRDQEYKQQYNHSQIKLKHFVDVKLVWTDVDQYDESRFRRFCLDDYYRDYPESVRKPTRLFIDLVYQRQALVGPSCSLNSFLI